MWNMITSMLIMQFAWMLILAFSLLLACEYAKDVMILPSFKLGRLGMLRMLQKTITLINSLSTRFHSSVIWLNFCPSTSQNWSAVHGSSKNAKQVKIMSEMFFFPEFKLQGICWLIGLQCYVVFVLEHGGTDLESFVLSDFDEAKSLLAQVDKQSPCI